MRQLLMKVEYLKGSSLYIGKVGEERATEVIIDMSYWKELYPDDSLNYKLIYIRPDKMEYEVSYNFEGNSII